MIKFSSLPEAGEELVVEDGGLAVHLLDSDLGVADHDVTLGQQPPGHLLLGVPEGESDDKYRDLTWVVCKLTQHIRT